MLKIIAAVTTNGVIGKNKNLPFHLQDDLRRFKQVTVNFPVVSGRVTYFTIPKKYRPLPDRENIVLTRSPGSLASEKVTVITDFRIIVDRGNDEDIFVIGGAEVYSLALPYTKEMYITRIHAEIEGDTFFPVWDRNAWELISSEDHAADEKN